MQTHGEGSQLQMAHVVYFQELFQEFSLQDLLLLSLP